MTVEVSPILSAVYRGDEAAVERLRSMSPSLTLFEAAAIGDAAGVRRLVADEPAGVNTHSVDGWTALHLASFFGHVGVVEALLAARADVHARSRNSHGNTPLHAAAAGRGDIRIVSQLLAAGADVDAAEPAGYRPLHLAAGQGKAAVVDTLLARGAAAEARTSDGKTALALAEEGGHAMVARRLRGEMP